MPKLLEQLQHTVDATIPDKEEFTHGPHPHVAYTLLILRNVLVFVAAILFVCSLFFADISSLLKAVAYFCGAGAYLFECLLVTECFHKKVPHHEMFMIYCLGPLYILLGISYIL